MNDMAGSGEQVREFPMTDGDFNKIRKLVHVETGISLAPTKKDMVYGRLSKRLRALGIKSFRDYIDRLNDAGAGEMPHLVNAITTNLTYFFREAHHFEYLKSNAIPETVQYNARSQRMRIWSAGCSTGEEPYSIAITLYESMQLSNWDCRILATDLDSNVLQTGSEGVYDIGRIDGLNALQKKKYFLHHDDKVKIKQILRPYITFRQLNLLHDWPMQGPFDVIFCRNVLIYFDQPTQQSLYQRYADMLRPGGYLIIGHSESMHPKNDHFDYLGKTIYRRVA